MIVLGYLWATPLHDWRSKLILADFSCFSHADHGRRGADPNFYQGVDAPLDVWLSHNMSISGRRRYTGAQLRVKNWSLQAER